MSEPLPIVLVPGLACSARLFAPQLPRLWRFGPVTIADHRRDDTMDAIATRILAMAPPRFALVGLSMGGYIAMLLTHLAPERVAKLALLDTTARLETERQTAWRLPQIAMAEEGRFADVVDRLFPLFVHRNRYGDATLKRVVGEMAEETGPEAFVRQQKAIMTRPDCRPMLAAYTAYKSGHALNNLLLRKLLDDPSAWDIVSFDDESKAPPGFAELAPAW